MQHLVENDVFDGVTRHTRVVEDAADDDGVVGGIVVAEAAAGVVLAPGKLRAAHEPVKEAAVEVFEDFFQMVVVAAGGVDVLASADLADEASFGGNIVAGDIATITGTLGTINRSAIKLGEQDVGDRVQHGFGSAFEQVGEADVELSLAQADGVIDGDESIETNVHGRRGHAGAEIAIGFVKDLHKLWGHVEGRVARPTILTKIAELRSPKGANHRGSLGNTEEPLCFSPVNPCAPCGKELCRDRGLPISSPEFAKGLVKDFGEPQGHDERRVARPTILTKIPN